MSALKTRFWHQLVAPPPRSAHTVIFEVLVGAVVAVHLRPLPLPLFLICPPGSIMDRETNDQHPLPQMMIVESLRPLTALNSDLVSVSVGMQSLLAVAK